MRLWLGVAVLALGACSGGTGEEEAPAPAKEASASAKAGARACDVIDKASVDAAMGRDMGQPSSNLDSMCQYMWSGEKLADQAQATLTIEAVPLSALEPGIKAEGGTLEPVAGIGTRAAFSPQFGLYVEHGGRTGIYLAGSGVGESEAAANKDRMIALARATAARL